MGADSACIFEDIGELSRGAASCATHDPKGKKKEGRNKCNVPRRSRLFTCGFSCKTLSAKNQGISGKARKTVLSEGTGSSGKTFEGTVQHVALSRPLVVLLENVDDLTKEDSSNLACLWDMFAQINYGGAMLPLTTSHFGLPQHRRRAWIVLLDCLQLEITLGEARAKATDMLALCARLGSLGNAGDLNTFLLDDDDEVVEDELCRKLMAAKGEKEGCDWWSQHEQFVRSKGYTCSALRKYVKDIEDTEWYDALKAREKAALSYGLTIQGKEEKGPLLAVDISQRVDRMAYSYGCAFNTLCPASKWWIVERKRLLTGWESLRLQGFPMQWVEKARADAADAEQKCVLAAASGPSDPLLADLAGNAFSGPVVQAALIGMLTLWPEPLTQPAHRHNLKKPGVDPSHGAASSSAGPDTLAVVMDCLMDE